MFFETSDILRTTQRYNSKGHVLQFPNLFILPKIYRRKNCDLDPGAGIFCEQSFRARSFSYLFVVKFFNFSEREISGDVPVSYRIALAWIF
jgi:hypothetical protein